MIIKETNNSIILDFDGKEYKRVENIRNGIKSLKWYIRPDTRLIYDNIDNHTSLEEKYQISLRELKLTRIINEKTPLFE